MAPSLSIPTFRVGISQKKMMITIICFNHQLLIEHCVKINLSLKLPDKKCFLMDRADTVVAVLVLTCQTHTMVLLLHNWVRVRAMFVLQDVIQRHPMITCTVNINAQLVNLVVHLAIPLQIVT